MALERTLSIVKPDGVAAISSARCIAVSRRRACRIIAARMLHLSQREAEGFYAVHTASVRSSRTS